MYIPFYVCDANESVCGGKTISLPVLETAGSLIYFSFSSFPRAASFNIFDHMCELKSTGVTFGGDACRAMAGAVHTLDTNKELPISC